MIAIADYGVGNLFSLRSSFEFIGADVVVTKSADELRAADKIVLPGVGAFRDAADLLEKSGLKNVIVEEAKAGKPLLGICLGMQLLFDRSFEYGTYEGLGLIKGDVAPIADDLPVPLKIPQIGWNALSFPGEKNRLFKYIDEGDCVYFVHSYYAKNCDESVIATTEYGIPITAAVARDNIFGCQFHPEKSGEVGLKILRAFCEI